LSFFLPGVSPTNDGTGHWKYAVPGCPGLWLSYNGTLSGNFPYAGLAYGIQVSVSDIYNRTATKIVRVSVGGTPYTIPTVNTTIDTTGTWTPNGDVLQFTFDNAVCRVAANDPGLSNWSGPSGATSLQSGDGYVADTWGGGPGTGRSITQLTNIIQALSQIVQALGQLVTKLKS
jgi:hypothetical protein